MTTPTAQSPVWRSPDNLISAALLLFAFSVVFSVTAVQATLFLTIILILVKKHRENTLSDIPTSLASHPFFVPWMIYLGVCLLTSLTAYYPAKGFGQLNSDFLKYVCLSALLLAVRKPHLPALSAVYTAAAAIAALVGIFEVASAIASGAPATIRANAFMNAVRYGEVMAIALTLGLSRLLLPQPRGASRHAVALYTLASAAIFTALILSQTRGAYLGVFTALLSSFIFARQTRKRILLLALLMFGAGAAATAINPAVKQRVFAIVSTDRQDRSFDSPSTAINIRLELWELGFKMLKAHPLVGVGPDNVKKVFKRFHPEPVGYLDTWGSLHSIYIHQAAERGLLGLGALLLLFAALFLFALRRYRTGPGPYTLWALCALPAYFVMNLTEISFQHVHTSFAIFLALAFAAAAEKENA